MFMVSARECDEEKHLDTQDCDRSVKIRQFLNDNVDAVKNHK